MHVLLIILAIAFVCAGYSLLVKLENRARVHGHHFLVGPPGALLMVLVVLGVVCLSSSLSGGDSFALGALIIAAFVALVIWNFRRTGFRLGLLGSVTQGVLLLFGVTPVGMCVLLGLCLVVFTVHMGRRSVLVTWMR